MVEANDPRARRATGPALLGLALTLAGPFAYARLLGVPWIRTSAAPAWILIALGLLLALRAARPGSGVVAKIALGLALTWSGFFAFGVLFLTRVPEAGPAARAERAADFSLPDQRGHVVALSDVLAKGPALLVFFRGEW